MTKEEFYSVRKKIIENDFKSLNNMQKNAVFSTEGPLLVLAGAGSGKTTVLVNRIAYLIKYGHSYYSEEDINEITQEEAELLNKAVSGESDLSEIDYLLKVYPVKPWQILAITFTNKAANELKTRLSDMLGPEGNDIWASTFHSACVRILRRGAGYLGYTSDFTIYDIDDSKRVIKECMKELDLSDKIIAVKNIQYEISNAKNSMVSAEKYIASNENDYTKSSIGKVYSLYQNKLKKSDAMDFDDLIFNTVLLFQTERDILEHYQNQFRYILVDEYQDTNHLQYVLVSMLADKYKNICVVGDDDQSIYRFRGATIENILDFENQYENTKVIRLEQNYRSTKTILDAANSIIKNNIGRKGKTLWTENDEGDSITYHKSDSDRDEAYYVVGKIMKEYRQKQKYSDFAVLYRMNSQSSVIEQYLVSNGIPYRIIGGHKFYDRKEIKDAISYLSVISNPNDYVRMQRIINEPKRGIGDSSFAYVREISEALDIPMIEVMANASDYPKLSRSAKNLKSFAELILSHIELAQTEKPSVVLKEILENSGYIQSLDLEPERKIDRKENLDQLLNNIIHYEEDNEEAELSGFLEEISLMTDIDNYNSDTDAVVLMTVHSAKGLEFDTVFLIGMEESIFPSDMSIQEGPGGIEEERRLAYVAVTRAKKKLYITNSKQRMLFGMTRFNPQSRFIEEISPELIEAEGETGNSYYGSLSGYSYNNYNDNNAKKEKSKPDNYGFSGLNKPKPVNSVKFKVGDTVIHKAYGEGVVLSVTPIGNDNMLEIAFIEGMTKKIMANYAKVEKKK